MMKVILSIFSSFILVQAVWAFNLGESIYCDKNDQYLYKNISCCLPRVPKEKCEELINRHLKLSTLSRVQSTINAIRNGEWQWGAYPNCFWNAISYHEQELAIEPLEVQQFEYYLEKGYLPIGKEELDTGDIVVFDKNYLSWKLGMNMQRVWSTVRDVPHHTVIYLEDDFVFQKEGVLTEVFSIDKMDYIFFHINIWIKSIKHTKNQYATTRFYRRSF